MKKVLFLFVFILVSIGLSAKVVRPVKYNWTVKHIPDGEYNVYVDWKSVKPAKDGCYLTFEVFLPDRYTASMLEKLVAGDYIYFLGKPIKVVDKKREARCYVAKYESCDGCYELCFTSDHVKGYFVPFEDPNGPEMFYTSHGVVTLKIHEFRACYDTGKTEVVKGSRISSYIKKNRKKESFMRMFWSYITVKNGKVVLLESSYGV